MTPPRPVRIEIKPLGMNVLMGDPRAQPLPPLADLSDDDYITKSANSLNVKGKVAELRLELNSGGKKDKNHAAKKIALKKIVANMTMSNNDMVALFPDVVGCMQIPSLEIKKMLVRSIVARLNL